MLFFWWRGLACLHEKRTSSTSILLFGFILWRMMIFVQKHIFTHGKKKKSNRPSGLILHSIAMNCRLPTICTAFAKINGLFRLILSATTTTALRCMLLLLSQAFDALSHAENIKAADLWSEQWGHLSVSIYRTGRHCVMRWVGAAFTGGGKYPSQED